MCILRQGGPDPKKRHFFGFWSLKSSQMGFGGHKNISKEISISFIKSETFLLFGNHKGNKNNTLVKKFVKMAKFKVLAIFTSFFTKVLLLLPLWLPKSNKKFRILQN